MDLKKRGVILKSTTEITFWRVAFPTLAMVMVGAFTSPINTFISSGVSRTSLEAIGTAGGLLILFSVLISLLTGGSGIIVGQYIGKKNSQSKIKKAVDSTFFVTVAQSILIIILVVPMAPFLLHAWGIEYQTEQMRIALLYVRILGPMFLVVSLIGYFISITTVYGHPKWSMIIGVSTIFIDATLSSVFVFSMNMGAMGVILGTVISKIVSLIFAAIVYSKYVQYFWKIGFFDWVIIKKIIGISIPIGGEKLNYNIGVFVQGIIIGQLAFYVGMYKYGHNYMLWSRSIFNSIQVLVLFAGVAFSISLEQVVSRRLGEGKIQEANHIVWKAMTYSVLIDVTMCIFVFFIHDYIIDWLTTKENNKEAIKMLKDQLYWPFLILIFLELGRCANLIYIAACRTAGDSKFTALMSVPITWITQILLVWILVKYTHLGFTGVAIGLMLDECIRGVINYVRWKSKRWTSHLQKLHT